MNTFVVSATATLVVAAAIAQSVTPAHAGRWHARARVAAHGHIVRPPVVVRRPIVVAPAPVYVAPAPVYVAPQGNWAAHVNFCLAKYASYDVGTNTYVSNSGNVKTCNSPYI